MFIKILAILSKIAYSSYEIRIKLQIIFALVKLALLWMLQGTLCSIRISKYVMHFPNPKVALFLIREILITQEYKFNSDNDSPQIIDCGANLGVSVLYFKLLYPNSTIIAIEADINNYVYLARNTKGMSNVRIFNNFVGVDDSLVIKFFSGGAGDLRSSSNSERGGKQEILVNTITLNSLVGKTNVDFLKVDIEGGEHLIFNNCGATDFLNNVSQAIVEYHHNYSNEANKMSDFIRCFESYGFSLQIVGIAPDQNIGNRYFQDILFSFKKIPDLT
jgi:FkbM family methyltransferase